MSNFVIYVGTGIYEQVFVLVDTNPRRRILYAKRTTNENVVSRFLSIETKFAIFSQRLMWSGS
jgi:hypothetical protein